MLPELYSECLSLDPDEGRRREREAFDLVIAALQDAMSPAEREDALQKAETLWMFLLDDLSKDENRLPVELRAKLISIGLWALKEITSMRLDKKRRVNALTEVCQIIRDGLE